MTPFGRLVLIGEPSCAGKPHLIDRMQRGECPRLCAALGFDRPANWECMSARQYAQNSFDRFPRLLLHFDFYTQSLSNSRFGSLEDICDRFGDVRFLTLQTEHDLLRRRTTRKLWSNCTMLFSKLARHQGIVSRVRKLWQQRRRFADRAFVAELYREWFRAVDGISGRHWIIDPLNLVSLRPHTVTRVGEPTLRRAA